MRNDMFKMVMKLADLDNSKQLSHEDAEMFVDFFIQAVKVDVLQRIHRVLEGFNFAVYDHPYFADVSTEVVGEDFVDYLLVEIESM